MVALLAASNSLDRPETVHMSPETTRWVVAGIFVLAPNTPLPSSILWDGGAPRYWPHLSIQRAKERRGNYGPPSLASSVTRPIAAHKPGS